MRRGEIWTVAGGPLYAGKPRPSVIVQDERLLVTSSITVCGLTSTGPDAPLFRPTIIPSKENGLRAESRIMVDKITTVPAAVVGELIGQLSAGDLRSLDAAIMIFLGLSD